MAIYLGIDAGGTSTRCAIGDEQRVLGKAAGPSSKIARVGAAMARDALQSVIREACSAARVNSHDISHTCIGIAGASRPDVVQTVQGWAGEILRGKIEVVGDMLVALEAAFSGGEGLIIIAGTGSIAFGRNQGGQTARAGGGGPEHSDEGSGEWIGRAAVHEVLRSGRNAHDSPLLRALMSAWNVASRDELEARAGSNPAPDYSRLFPTVQAAAESDQNARGILEAAGGELAMLAASTIRQLWPAPQRVRVAIAGGVLQSSAIVRGTLVTKLRFNLQPAGYEIAISFGVAEPVMGALSLARRAATALRKGTA